MRAKTLEQSVYFKEQILCAQKHMFAATKGLKILDSESFSDQVP